MGEMNEYVVPKLTAPLSELTKIFQHIPIENIDAWCNRPIEQREREQANKMKISRPMNMFFLYRKAYRERCMAWLMVNDNRVVSHICGQSWALEPLEIKQLFSYYAEMERRNHSKAYPGYKFSPKAAKRKIWKRKRAAPEDENEKNSEHPSEADYVFSPKKLKRTSRKRKDVTLEDEAVDEADDEADDEDEDGLF